jgi:hypothetical protein
MDFSKYLHKAKLWLDDHAERRPPKSELRWVRAPTASPSSTTPARKFERAAYTEKCGTFAWSEFVLGAPGMRLGGGRDEIQRNTIAERVLGLPREPR